MTLLPTSRSRLRHYHAGSSDAPGRIGFVILRTSRSPPVAPHPASRRRSYIRLRARDAGPKGTCTPLIVCAHGRTWSGHPAPTDDVSEARAVGAGSPNHPEDRARRHRASTKGVGECASLHPTPSSRPSPRGVADSHAPHGLSSLRSVWRAERSRGRTTASRCRHDG
jgi:hypothetical protein